MVSKVQKQKSNCVFWHRYSAASLHPWWGTCRSWSSTSPSEVWPTLTRLVLKRNCAKYEASSSSFLWTSCLSITSCLLLEQRRPWSQLRSGHKRGRDGNPPPPPPWPHRCELGDVKSSVLTVTIAECLIVELQESTFDFHKPDMRVRFTIMAAGYRQIF